MADVSCHRARDLAARAELGELTEAEAMQLELHLQGCPRCAASEVRVRGLVDLLAEEPLPEPRRSDRALVNEALMRAGGPDADAPRASKGRWRPLLAIAAAALLVAGGAFALFALDDGASDPVAREAAGGRGEPDPGDARGEDGPARTTGPTDSRGETAPDGEAAPTLAGGRGQPCPGVTAQVSDRSEASVLRAASDRCRLELRRGELALRVDPAAGTRLTVETPTSLVHVLGTVLSVRVDDGGTSVVVERGRVRVEGRDESRRIGPGERAAVSPVRGSVAVDAAEAPDVRALSTFATSLGLPERPAEAEAPEERARRPVEGRRRVARLRRMLRDAAPQAVRAQARREMADPRLARRRAELMTIVAESYAAEQRYREAVTAYARVWQGPRSTTAGNALVAAADLALLRLSEPRRARGLYERYLREYPQGPLREVAAAGRCRALHATGATEATRRCVASYARRYPDGRFRGVVDALGER